MGITFEDMEQQAREILNLPEDDGNIDQGLALVKALVEASQGEYETPQERTQAIFDAYRADDVLTSIKLNAKGDIKNGQTVLDRFGYTPEKSKFAMMTKADQLSRAVATEHGQSVISDIASQVDNIEQLVDAKALGPTAFERVANDHGLNLPEGFANLLRRHTNRGLQEARMLTAADMIKSVNDQFTGLLNKGEAMLEAEGSQPPHDELGAHAG